MLLNHIKISLRNIQRQTGYTLINIVSLTIGLISVIFIAFWLQEEIGYDQFHKNKAGFTGLSLNKEKIPVI